MTQDQRPQYATPATPPAGAPPGRRVHRKKATDAKAFVIPPGVPENHVATDGWIYYPPPGAPNLPPHMRAMSPAQAAAIKGPALMRLAYAPPDPEIERLNREYYAANPYKPPPEPPREPLFPITPEMRKAMDTPIIPREIVLPPEKEAEIQRALDEKMAAWERGERPDFAKMDAEDKARMDAEAERYAREEAEEKRAKGGKKRRRTEPEDEPEYGEVEVDVPGAGASAVTATPGVTYAVPGLAVGTSTAAPPMPIGMALERRFSRDAFSAWIKKDGLSQGTTHQIANIATRAWRIGTGHPKAELGQEMRHFDPARLLRWWDVLCDDLSPSNLLIRYGWGFWARFWVAARPHGVDLPAQMPALPLPVDRAQAMHLPLPYLKAVGILASYCPGWADPMTWQASFWTAELGALLTEKRAALPVFSANPAAFEALAPGEKLLLYFAALQDDLASYAAPLGWVEGQRIMPRVPYSDRCPDVDTMQRIIQLGMMSPAELAAAQAAPAKRRRGRPAKWTKAAGGGAA